MKKLSLNTINTKFNDLVDYLQNSDKGFRALIITCGALGLTAFLSQLQPQEKEAVIAKPMESIDTYIPADKGLYTIEVENYESLDQIIGQFGVVDLYSVPLSREKRAKLVIRKVKIVRTAKSPRHFNVLLEEDQVGVFAGHIGTFTALVRNPKVVGTKIVKEKGPSKRRRILYESEI